MALLESLGGLSGLGGSVVNVGLLIFGLMFVLGIGGGSLAIWWFRFKRYKQYKITVFEKDAFDNIHSYDDDGAIFDKGGNRRLWLRKSRISMPGDDLPFFFKNKTKCLFVIKKGTKNFVLIEPEIDDSHLSFNVGEEDLNWALIEFDHSSKSFSQSLLLQYMPYMIVVFSLLIVMVIAVMIIKKFDIALEIAKELGGHLSRVVV